MRVTVNTSPSVQRVVTVSNTRSTAVTTVGIQGPTGATGADGSSGITALSQASDVDMTDLRDGHVMVYQQSTEKWKSTTLLNKQAIDAGEF